MKSCCRPGVQSRSGRNLEVLGVGTKETTKKYIRINSCPLCRGQIEVFRLNLDR